MLPMPSHTDLWFLKQFDSYFMDLENYCITVVDYNLMITAMLSRKSRAEIPEWFDVITSFLDYDDEENKIHKLSLYKRWVEHGYGDDWFIGSEDECIIDIESP